MKASVLTGEVNLWVKEKLGLRSKRKNLSQKFEEFFAGSFESDWEKRTDLDWREWGKYPHVR